MSNKMPIELTKHARTRPYLFHLTARENLDRIRRTRRLTSAASLLAAAGEGPVVRHKRSQHRAITLGGEVVWIRDQAPLHAGNIEFVGGWCFEDFVEHLNSHVFFWSGWERGPCPPGLRHCARYKDEEPALLRIRFLDLRDANSPFVPLFCRYNSGSPRCSYGRKSPRGPETFVTAQDAPYSAGRVVEVVFRDQITLPPATQLASDYGGPWQTLFA